MNSLNLKLTTLAAAVVIAAGTASAQDVTLRAAVPFSYTVQTGKVMPAGEYTVKHEGSSWRIRGDQTAVIPFGISKQSNTSDTPKLVFECRAHGCALRQVQVGRGENGAYWPAGKNKSDAAETARLVVVPLRAS